MKDEQYPDSLLDELCKEIQGGQKLCNSDDFDYYMFKYRLPEFIHLSDEQYARIKNCIANAGSKGWARFLAWGIKDYDATTAIKDAFFEQKCATTIDTFSEERCEARKRSRRPSDRTPELGESRR